MRLAKSASVILVICFAFFSCTNAPEAAVEEYLSLAELEQVVTKHIEAELETLGQPTLKDITIRDTMFIREFLEREKTIYERGLVDGKKNLNLAIGTANEARNLLEADPTNEALKRNLEAAERRVRRIEENFQIVDSLSMAIKLMDETDRSVQYYEVLLSYDGKDADERPINFLARVGGDGTVQQAARTRVKARTKK